MEMGNRYEMCGGCVGLHVAPADLIRVLVVVLGLVLVFFQAAGG